MWKRLIFYGHDIFHELSNNNPNKSQLSIATPVISTPVYDYHRIGTDYHRIMVQCSTESD